MLSRTRAFRHSDAPMRPDRHRARRALALLPIAWAVMLVVSLLTSSLWFRMVLSYAVLIPAALLIVRLDGKLFRPNAKLVVLGAAAAGAFLALSRVGFAVLEYAIPDSKAQADELYVRLAELPPAAALPLLVLVVLPGEEIVWRGAVTLSFAERFGAWRGALGGAAAFAAFHFGEPPLLIAAAFAAGLFWGLLSVWSKSLVPALVSHALWDVTVFYLAPF